MIKLQLIPDREKYAICDVTILPYMEINWQSISIYSYFVTSLTAYYSCADIIWWEKLIFEIRFLFLWSEIFTGLKVKTWLRVNMTEKLRISLQFCKTLDNNFLSWGYRSYHFVTFTSSWLLTKTFTRSVHDIL